MREKIDTVIIGGGLSGLYAAYLLVSDKNFPILLEARPRVGGRILSPEHRGFFADLGPSWYWPTINPRVKALVEKLGLQGYPQFEIGFARFQAKDGHVETVSGYPMDPSGWRLEGGMISLVKGLHERLPKGVVRLDNSVCEIKRQDNGIQVVVGLHDHKPDCVLEASRVILALPPRLAASSILFTPDLSHDLTQSMLKASTWMAGHAKFFALYDSVSWSGAGLSGQGFSLCGPMGEIHDGSGPGGKDMPGGLTGFVGIPAMKRKRRTDREMIQPILDQLALIYGREAGEPIRTYYKDWAKEEFTATEYDQWSVHNHPEFLPPSGKKHTWNGTLQLAGSETADHFPGYLEGALQSAERAVLSISMDHIRDNQ